MKYKTTWFPLDGSEPTETVYDTLEDVAQLIRVNAAEWEDTGRGFYVDWVDDGTVV